MYHLKLFIKAVVSTASILQEIINKNKNDNSIAYIIYLPYYY